MLSWLKGGRVRMVARNGNDRTDKFQVTAEALKRLRVRSATLDGEVVRLTRKGTSSSGNLQKDLSKERSDRLTYVVFDLLALDDYVLTGCGLEDRKRVLQLLVRRAPPQIHYSDHVIGHWAEFYAKACAASLEGIVSKRRLIPTRSQSRLAQGQMHRPRSVRNRGLDAPGGTCRHFGSLLLGYYDTPGRLHYAGLVGTGFNEERLQDVHKRRKPLERRTSPLTVKVTDLPPGPHWVEPKLVAEVRFVEWARDRHVRYPSFLGLREDKKARDVVLDPRVGTSLA